MEFKSEYHGEMYSEYIKRLNNSDRFYRTFAFIAAAIGKKQIIDTLGDHEIDGEKLIYFARGWSTSERAMIELAYQCFNGGNLFFDKDEYPIYPTLHDIMFSLDNANSGVVIQALAERYLP